MFNVCQHPTPVNDMSTEGLQQELAHLWTQAEDTNPQVTLNWGPLIRRFREVRDELEARGVVIMAPAQPAATDVARENLDLTLGEKS